MRERRASASAMSIQWMKPGGVWTELEHDDEATVVDAPPVFKGAPGPSAAYQQRIADAAAALRRAK